MAVFSNQATLTYNGVATNSNIAYGEILDILEVSKISVEGVYREGSVITYAVSLQNTGSVNLTSLTVTDDLGAYEFNGATVYPLDYVDGSVKLFVNGDLGLAPAVTAGPPLAFSGISIPANGDAVLIYQALANNFADPQVGGTIENTVTVSGNGLNVPATASATVDVSAEPVLTIAKSITPSQVVDNDRVSYTFILENTGNQELDATGNAQITDTFDPILTDLTVVFNGVTWTEGVEYNYDEATGLFSTVAGQITVPAATYTQDPVSGSYSQSPGVSTLVITGTI